MTPELPLPLPSLNSSQTIVSTMVSSGYNGPLGDFSARDGGENNPGGGGLIIDIWFSEYITMV